MLGIWLLKIALNYYIFFLRTPSLSLLTAATFFLRPDNPSNLFETLISDTQVWKCTFATYYTTGYYYIGIHKIK